MELREGLNAEQAAAVEHGAGPLLVVAGAGTGKTQVITRRIARLIAAGEAKPEEILALTFTEKAAGEMLDRLDGLVGWQAYRVNVMTFHAFGLQLIQRFGHHLGWSTRTEVIPPLAKLILLKQNLSRIALSYYGPQADILDFLQEVVAYIEALQNADIGVEEFRRYVEALKPGPELHRLDINEQVDRLKLYELYEAIKRENGLIDYHDQIKLPLELLQQKPNIVAQLQQEYRYVLVDEYQDTNSVQDGLLRALVPQGGNIFVVGDDDQAIYGFRGAQLANILEFSKHFGVKRPVTLTENYRSTQPILDAAYRMIRHNDPERLEARLGIDKQLHAQTTGPAPQFLACADSRAEAETVAAEIAKRLADGTAPEALAVLATSHNALRTFARVLRQRQIPYQLSSNVNIFEQPEIVQLWHLLRWVGLAAEDEAVVQLLSGPFVGWSNEQVRRLVERSREGLVGLEAALDGAASSDKAAQALVSRLEAWRQQAKQLPVSQLVYHIVFDGGLSERWIAEAQTTPRMVRVFEDLQAWLHQMQQYEGVALDATLAGYLATFPKPPEIETEELVGEESGVKLLTIHASKGLEFDVVFLINNTQDAWGANAGNQAVTVPAELAKTDIALAPEHERRRLLYVAMTRARQELILSAPLYQKGGRSRKLSPFLNEIFDPKALAVPQPADNLPGLEESLQRLQQYAPPMIAQFNQKLPFEKADGWLELSASDLEAYNDCPFEFSLERVLKIRLPLGPQAGFGSLMHDLFHDYYASRQKGDGYSLEQLQQRLAERWSNRGYQTAEEAELARETAAQTLTRFYEREEAAQRPLWDSEADFCLTLPEAKLRVRGRIDAAFSYPEGLEVRDFKTGRRRDPERLATLAKDSLQLRTYALATTEMTGRPPARVVLDYVVTGVEGVATLTPLILKNHRQKLAQIAEQIRQHNFAPKTDRFHVCPAQRYWGDPEAEPDEA